MELLRKHPESGVRMEAAQALGDCRLSSELISELRAAVESDSDYLVRYHADRAIKRLNGAPYDPMAGWVQVDQRVPHGPPFIVRSPHALLCRDSPQIGLNRSNCRPQNARCEKSGTKRARGVLTEWWQLLKRRSDLNIHVRDLPGDLVGGCCGLVRSSQPGRFRGVSSCPESVRAHVSDASSLSGSEGGSHSRRRVHRVRSSTSDEAPANFSGGIKFALSKRPGTSDGIAWATVRRRLRLENDQDSLSTVRCPRCDEAAISFAQRLRRRHASSFARQRQGDAHARQPRHATNQPRSRSGKKRPTSKAPTQRMTVSSPARWMCASSCPMVVRRSGVGS